MRKRTSREISSPNPNARYSGRQKYRRGDAANPLPLPRLEALLRLIDDVDAALATHEAVVAVAIAQGFQRITDFHVRHQRFLPRGGPTADKMKAVAMPQTAAAIKSATKDSEQGNSPSPASMEHRHRAHPQRSVPGQDVSPGALRFLATIADAAAALDRFSTASSLDARLRLATCHAAASLLMPVRT